MSSMSHRQKRDVGYDHDTRRDERKRRSRSSSRSRHRRYNDSRSRSQSVDYRKRRNNRRSRSRSRSRSYNRRDRNNSSRRHRDSRSRSNTRSHRSSKRDSRSRSPEKRSRNIMDADRRQYDNGAKCSTNNSTESSRSKTTDFDQQNTPDLQHLPLPKREPIGAYYNLDTDEPIDKERIHREMEEKLRQALAKEGKVYPPKKPEASHPVFANDGSFLEIFKKMQAQQQHPHVPVATAPAIVAPIVAPPVLASTSNAAASSNKVVPPPPIVGRRRGGKILKTGVVAKPKAQAEQGDDPKDFWSLYLAEVNKYKNHACDSDGGTRPLVK
ncbi:PREDICTED: arginine/serine-rich coiled-coil protein 2-like isoform X1 [Bactrocera latifrons]|uniref:arginine/serine-rich coiled-coil protein 2-like isoform X1 n=1 Tax=Bactrocera latifrons TaxID=174628 RepID=UPI0008DD4CF2|nr:PREDICTED: arginine/serine-rich coiled-coil protein 2-like isoform X1 [Bactrocera latifrons]XP_018797506.1 PREDICTED: arginine/serine-rich coiled-coil protein 2-like isoform X1 [Bactrocera latifrons]XP_018797507.1 PREDICTED: arginine/serine-rich coiled-coil protein 2-like isoform X1 [Bactrocera latifrons]XP_018797508.1 PREDICTED: arginine/serine-rich coiled-coil protein 2-like isoform X1 [Bactrocera latifrons]